MTELLTMIHQIPYCLFSCLVAAAKNDTPSTILGEWVGGLLSAFEIGLSVPMFNVCYM